MKMCITLLLKTICFLIQIEASPKEKVNNADFENSEVFFPLPEVPIDEIDVLETSGLFNVTQLNRLRLFTGLKQ